MSYWLLSGGGIHGGDIRPEFIGRPWSYHKILDDVRLRAGDVVYCSFGHGLYAWGYVLKKETYQDEQLGQVLRVDVTRTQIRYDLLTQESIDQVTVLKELFANRRDNLEKLTSRQVNDLNRALRMRGNDAPPDVSEDQDVYSEIGRLRQQPESVRAVLNQPLKLEEMRFVEFKEITSARPVDAIKNTADEYAVAYLNRSGGRIFWGVRDSDRVVVGLALDYQQRDALRREISVKLAEIQPHVPFANFLLELHPVLDVKSNEIPDMYLVELSAPRGSAEELYATGSGEVFIKTEGGKQKLDHLQIVAEIKRRLRGS